MNPFLDLLSMPAASRLGATLLHFLWQGAAVAGLLALALRLGRRQSARRRYAMSCVALAAMAALPLLTLAMMDAMPVAGDAGQAGAGHRVDQIAVVAHAGMVPATGLPPIPHGWLPWVTLAWLAGVVALGGRLAGGWWQVQRLRTRETRPMESPWPERLADLQRRMGITAAVELLESNRARVPMIIGWLRPVILLPLGFAAGMAPAQVDAILAHELAHLQRRDYLVNLLQRAVETLLFYHPAVWWVSERIRIEREFCCDDRAAEVIGDRTQLADALVTLAEQDAADPAFAFAADGGSVSQRVRRLLGLPTEASSGGWVRRLGLGLALAVVVLGGIWLGPLWMAPRLYVSTARIKVESPAFNDPYELLTTMRRLMSVTVLDAAAANLGLSSKWGVSDPLQLRARLSERIRVAPYRNTSLLEVSAASENPTESAEIANAVVSAYIDLKINQRIEVLDLPRQALRQKVDRCERRLAELDGRRRELSQELLAKPNALPKDYAAVESDLKIYTDLLTRLRTQLAEAEVGVEEIAPASPAEIIDSAIPALRRVAWRN
jgi:beta-lactamase regulating signal transducer with metallopeptidase domain